MAKLTIIVVTYNSAETIVRCLSSLPADVDTIVVDNASSDGTPEVVRERFPQVRVIASPKNLGFGAANNVGLRQAPTDLALLLNPDAWVEKPGSIEALAGFMENKHDAVACGGMLRHPDGSPQESACRDLTLWAVFSEQTFLGKLFPTYWVSLRHLRRSSDPLRVSQVMGACLLMRRVDGSFLKFDERFFLYCEDTELCARLQDHGSIWYIPGAIFGHELGSSSLTNRWQSITFYNRGKELYFAIHHGRAALATAWLLNRLGAALRLGIWSLASILSLFLVPKLRAMAAMFAKVLFASLDPYSRHNRASRV
ncbi:MAG: glycosyltransferase family 2 protein [Armatimonadetes bacterium]|nr:glycosyltransferase family 2 protein [Armatimonadota bacterium]